MRAMNKTTFVVILMCLLPMLCLSCGNGGATDEEAGGHSLKTWYKDADGDGYSDETVQASENQPEQYYLASELTAISGDCDDNNNKIYPGAFEIADDDIDQNCNGMDFQTWYKDADGDGYSDKDIEQSEVRPNNKYYLQAELVDILNDCDDNNNKIHPDGIEEYYDNIDSNCDGLDFDCLKDGRTYNGDYYIKYIQDVKNLEGYSVINGDLIISESSVSNLNGLECLTRIEGTLNIIKNEELINVDAFKNLTSIGGTLKLEGNSILTNLKGFQNLISVGRLIIKSNDELMNIEDLRNLTSIQGGLYIESNHSLTSLSGLDNITSIGDDLVIYNNSALTDITNLSSLTSVEDNLSIEYNSAIINLNGLGRLVSVGHDLVIEWNYALTRLNSLNNVISIGNDISIKSNSSLTKIDGLNSLTSIENNLIIERNQSLQTIEGFR